MAVNSLYRKLKPFDMDADIASKWNTIAPLLAIKHSTGTTEITPHLANMYRGDLYGLFKNELDMPEEYIYPHIRANGYDSSGSYDGKRLRFVLLEAATVGIYHNLFTKNKK